MKMLDINKYADRIQVLALDKRARQWQLLIEQLQQMGGNPTPFVVGDGKLNFEYDLVNPEKPVAWAGSPQSYAHFCSVLEIVSRAKRDNIERLMFFEDDAVLRDCFSEVLSEAYSQLSSSWQMLYFNPEHHDFDGQKSKRFDFYGANLYRCVLQIGLQGVIIHESMYDKILSLKDEAWINDNPLIDVTIAHQFHKGNSRFGRQMCFATYPNIVYESAGYSYNYHTVVDRQPYEDIRSRL